MSVSIYELKTQLSKYIALIEQGIEEEIEVTKNGKIVAILASKKEKKPIFNGNTLTPISTSQRARLL